MNVLICPKCHRISVEYDYVRRLWRCLWKECSWSDLDQRWGRPREEYDEDFIPHILLSGEELKRRGLT